MAKTMSTDWQDKEEKGSLVGFRFLLFIYKILGKTICTLFMLPVVLYFCLFDGKTRHASLGYLQRIYKHPKGQKHFSKAPGFWQAFKHYMAFAKSILDKFSVWLGRISFKDISWETRQEFVATLTPQKGAVFLVSHYGNHEIMRAISQETFNGKINIIMDKRNAENFTKLLKKHNQQSDVAVIGADEVGIDTAVLLKEKVDQGEIVTISADRLTVGSSERTVEMDFL